MALAAAVGERVPLRHGRAGAPGPRGGGVFLSRVQQTRLLDAAVVVVAERGVARLTARTVSACAGMSTKTFYDLFADSEDCLLAVFDRAVEELAGVVAPVWAGEGEWVQRVRGVLVVLLGCLERDRALARVAFVEALGGGPRVLARRAEVLDRVAGLIDEGRVGSPLAEVLPSLTAAGVAGAAFSIVHARLVEPDSGSLMELVGPVMATVVLPYRGREVSAGELERPVPELPELPGPVVSAGPVVGGGDAAVQAPVRLTERTCAVLGAVGEFPGGNNRRVAGEAGASEPQISRLLGRLAEHGLVENRAAGGRGGFAKAWWLTAAGEEFLRTGFSLAESRPAAGRERPAGRGRSKGAGAKGGGRGAKRRGGQRGVPTARIDPSDREARRARLLAAAAAAVDEHGYGAVTVAHITARAKISRRTFYELFTDRDECLLAVMRDIEARLIGRLQAAGLNGLVWRERVRRGLWTVLGFFDGEPVLARFCVVESARGEGRMASYRAELLARITEVIAEGREEALLAEPSPLIAEGIAGAIVSILNTRLATTRRRAANGTGEDATSDGLLRDTPGGPVSGLLGELMALIVLPYLGARLAHEERTRPAPTDSASTPLPALERGIREHQRQAA